MIFLQAKIDSGCYFLGVADGDKVLAGAAISNEGDLERTKDLISTLLARLGLVTANEVEPPRTIADFLDEFYREYRYLPDLYAQEIVAGVNYVDA